MNAHERRLPAFEIKDTQAAGANGLRRLDVYVVVPTEHMDRADAVALQVTKDHIQQASTDDEHDMVLTSIYSSVEKIRRDPADARAMYIADRVPAHRRPRVPSTAVANRLQHGTIRLVRSVM